MIDWTGSGSILLLNPRMPEDDRLQLASLHAAVAGMPAHVWLATSGTTGSLKLVGLAKEAILASARAVNRHLEAAASDVWCCVLPAFHVGGMGIHARAWLSGSRVLSLDWDPHRFRAGGFTLASLVPAQVSDLVRLGLRAPAGLRGVVVGGGELSERLYEAGRELGWPLLPSYGLTEAASQVATATMDSPVLRVLDHLEARSGDGRIEIRGESLLSGYAVWDERGEVALVDPKRDGWLDTEDEGEVRERVLTVRGRGEDFVKVGGESVDLGRLDAVLESLGLGEAVALGYPDERLGLVVHVATVGAGAGVQAAFNERVHPFERARVVWEVEAIPRTELGKVRRGELVRGILERNAPESTE